MRLSDFVCFIYLYQYTQIVNPINPNDRGGTKRVLGGGAVESDYSVRDRDRKHDNIHNSVFWNTNSNTKTSLIGWIGQRKIFQNQF